MGPGTKATRQYRGGGWATEGSTTHTSPFLSLAPSTLRDSSLPPPCPRRTCSTQHNPHKTPLHRELCLACGAVCIQGWRASLKQRRESLCVALDIRARACTHLHRGAHCLAEHLPNPGIGPVQARDLGLHPLPNGLDVRGVQAGGGCVVRQRRVASTPKATWSHNAKKKIQHKMLSAPLSPSTPSSAGHQGPCSL
jgi:hypothetical protein